MHYDVVREIATRLAGGSILSQQGEIESLLLDDIERSETPLENGIATQEDIQQVMEEYRAMGIRLTLQAEKLQAIHTKQVTGIDEQHHLSEDAYQTSVLRTYAGTAKPLDKLTLAVFGLAGESGEVVDHIKKVIYAKHPIDFVHLAEELGDILWYLVLACDAIGYSLQDVMQMNVEKLRKDELFSASYDLPAIQQRELDHDCYLHKWTDQEVTERYIKEMTTLKQGNAAIRRGERPKKYANTLMMNRCRRALELRGLLIPCVELSENEGVE